MKERRGGSGGKVEVWEIDARLAKTPKQTPIPLLCLSGLHEREPRPQVRVRDRDRDRDTNRDP